jgi:hypothetical protein
MTRLCCVYSRIPPPPVSLLFLVALTGIEPAAEWFSSAELGLSRCVFSRPQFATGT